MVLPGGVGGTDGVAEVPLGLRPLGLAQVGGVAEQACGDKGRGSEGLGKERASFLETAASTWMCTQQMLGGKRW